MMQAVTPHRGFDRFVLVLVIGVLASGITYLEVVSPSTEQVANFLHISTPETTTVRPPQPATPKAPAAAPAPAPTTAPAVTSTAPAATDSAKVTSKTATTTMLVHLRAGKSVSSKNIINLDPGTVVNLRDDSDATWQGVEIDGKVGYIYSEYLQF